MKKIINLFSILLTLVAFNNTNAQELRTITSPSDPSIPQEIRDKLSAFHFSVDYSHNSFEGEIQKTETSDTGNATIEIKYTYSFVLAENKVIGFINIEKKQAEQIVKIDNKVDFPVVLICCEQSSHEHCFKPDDSDGIAKATKNGCTHWYKKVVR